MRWPTSLARLAWAPTEPPRLDVALAQRAVSIARSEIGHGEDPELGDNRGADVDRYRAGDGTGLGPGGRGAWCAAFASYCFVTAAAELRQRLPFATTRGAKKLARRVGEAGRMLTLPEEGCLIAWHRLGADGVITWQGHVGIVVEYWAPSDSLTVIEGNKNGKRARLATVARFPYPNGSWRRKLALLASAIA